jgi:methyl-accepting chemotaxis protein
MFANWTFGRRIAAGFGLAGLTLILLVFLAYRTTAGLIDNTAQVDHTYLVRQNLALLMAQLTDAETGQRGYLITGVDSYLDPYTTAIKSIGETLDTVRQLTADNLEQQQRLATLTPIVDSKLAELQQTIDLRKAQGLDAAEQVVDNGSGQTEMDQIRAIIDAADQDEATLLQQRTAAAEASANWATAVILWAGLGGALFVGAIGFFITRSLSRQIGAAVGHLQSSSAELQSAANQQATGVREQVTSMNEINTTISELLATSRQIAESAQRVAHISEQTTSAARSGDGTVERANDSISGIRRQVDLVVGHMLELGKKSQQIGAVLDIVTELAEQTNILSINATIEAAGAGEAGKRFAVVADEIRKLADRVAGSAKEIRTLIDDVRSSVNTTVMATETGSKAVDTGSREFGDVATLFKQIAKLVATTTEAAREIELSTKQQATAVEQVNTAITNVAQATKETETSAGQTIQTASELATTSRDLLRLVRTQAAA